MYYIIATIMKQKERLCHDSGFYIDGVDKQICTVLKQFPLKFAMSMLPDVAS